VNSLRDEIHSGEFRQSRHYPVARSVERVAAQTFKRLHPDTEWPPVNGHFADVYRLASWRLLSPLETVAALDYETLTAGSWAALPDDQREAWFEHVRGTNSRLSRTRIGRFTAEVITAP